MAIKNHLFTNKTEQLGVAGEIVCPACEQGVNMPVFRNYDNYNIIATIKGEKQQLGIAVCPQCAAVFSVNPDYLKAVSEGTTVFLTAEDLKRLK